MKKFLREAFFAVLFVGIFAALLFGVSKIVMPKSDSADLSTGDMIGNGIVTEHENSIDVVLIGDSETYNAFIPMQLWKDYGFTSYVCGSPAQSLVDTEFFLTQVMNYQKPKLIAIETDTIFTNIGVGKYILGKGDKAFLVFRFHNRWKTLMKNKLLGSPNATFIENSKGYIYTSVIDPADTRLYMESSDEKEPLPKNNLNILQEIKKICDKNGTKLVFVSTPSTLNWSIRRHNTVEDLSKEMGVDYIDMNLLNDEIKIDWQKDTRDRGDHMNFSGALKVTDYFGRYVVSTSDVTDHRTDPAFADWNNDMKDYLRITATDDDSTAQQQ